MELTKKSIRLFAISLHHVYIVHFNKQLCFFFLIEGYNQLLLPSLDPIHISRLSLVQGAEKKVNINLNFMDIDMSGLKNAIAYKASGFNEISKLDYVDIRFKIPKLTIDGPYKSSGRILVLPIVGDGICHMELGILTNYFVFS